MSNGTLTKARKTKNDEFYTQYDDIENEMKYFVNELRNKIVYCNCDNPEWSNFWKYFTDHFHDLKLKKLISTHYNPNGNTYKMEYDGTNIVKTELECDGSFKCDECLKILEQCDVVITNPPFSLFRDYIQTLLDHDKKFLIIGSMNAIIYKNIFPLIKTNKIFVGNYVKKFKTPENEIKRFGNICWFNNMKNIREDDVLKLDKTFNDTYKCFDNYDILNVDKIADIPNDYFGAVGVPITFLFKYNQNQFEILDARDYMKTRSPNIQIQTINDSVNGVSKFTRIAVKLKHTKNENVFDIIK